MSVLEATTPAVDAAEHIEAWFGPRAADVDNGSAGVREGLAELGRLGLPSADIAASVALVRETARHDISSAFSAWAHRMTIDYISSSPPDSSARAHLPDLAAADTLGATALAAGTAHVLAGVPLPVTFRIEGDEIVLDGRIPWASNLLDPFVVVTAAAAADDPDETIVVAIASSTPGLSPAPYPELLALNATGSTTVKLEGVRVPTSAIVSRELTAFVDDVLARFLLLQGAFCSGLANRALEEAEGNLGPFGDSIRPQLAETSAETAAADERSARFAADEIAGREVPAQDLLALRLRWSELVGEAVHLELAATGGRGYLSTSPTARRLREAAFLPIQAPTEVLLRWLLSRSA